MRRLGIVLVLLLVTSALIAAPGSFPTDAKPARAQADLSHPVSSSSGAVVSTHETTGALRVLGLFGLINAVLDATADYLRAVSVEEALGLAGAVAAGVYGVRKARKALGGRRRDDE